MSCFLVGGAVRDRLLGLPVGERDWVVVGTTEGQMLEQGYRRADAEFPVFLHPESGEEYALARIETKIGPGYKGFSVEAGPGVTLEEDLARRDLTINALAEDETGRLIDCFNGLEDLENGILRHISPAFEEDPVRLLRVARFATKLGPLGFRVALETSELMKHMATSEDLRALKPERIWKELGKSLGEGQPWRFFEVLHHCGALKGLIPELAVAMEDEKEQQDSTTVADLKRAAVATADPTVRFAVVMHRATGPLVDQNAFCHRLRAPKTYCELLGLVRQQGEAFLAAATGDAEVILRLLQQTRAMHQPERFAAFLQACGIIWPVQATQAMANLEKAERARCKVSAADLQARGLEGPELGQVLQRLQLEAIRRAL